VLIRHILHRKDSDVATIAPAATVADAVALLRERNIGALVVTESDEVAGIISERDIVRALADPDADADAGTGLLDRPVADLMTSVVATCEPGATVDELMRVMTDRRIRHVPVVDGGALVGIVSIGDVVKSRIDELQTETETLHDYLASGR
jgi:CBS domain-containing protein